MKTSLFKKIIWPVLYILISIGICTSICMIVIQRYYQNVFVDGSSMSPTLNGEIGVKDGAHFGYTDNSKKAINNLSRFDVVTTYYPFPNEDYVYPYSHEKPVLKEDAIYKIKRVIALPNETFKIEANELFILNSENIWESIPFVHKGEGIQRNLNAVLKNIPARTLEDNEYWVMGDNWATSKDSATYLPTSSGYLGPVYKENIVGKLVAVLGTCTLVEGDDGKIECTDKNYFNKPWYF